MGNFSFAPPEMIDSLYYTTGKFNTKPLKARFFVIKSYTDEDVHKAIKYSVWSSTADGNKKLDAAFEDAQKNNSAVYLLFSVNGSGRFCGVAQMMTRVQYNQDIYCWSHFNKWKGKFNIQWQCIKDIMNKNFRHIKIQSNDNKPVTNSRDTQEVPYH